MKFLICLSTLAFTITLNASGVSTSPIFQKVSLVGCVDMMSAEVLSNPSEITIASGVSTIVPQNTRCNEGSSSGNLALVSVGADSRTVTFRLDERVYKMSVEFLEETNPELLDMLEAQYFSGSKPGNGDGGSSDFL